MFKEYINIQKQNIISSICDLITYPSISVESNNPHFPFGRDCKDALKYFLQLANSLGFHTKDLDGYCGYAEFGEGDELIGIVGHLDVVPAIEQDWSYSPFTPTIHNNKIYGRGAIDDKGPVISNLYAMKAVMEYIKENNIVSNKRVRLIVGLNEEKDWKCIEYYKNHEEIPTIGYSPDADFPCIYAEKSVVSLLLKEELLIYKNPVFQMRNGSIQNTIPILIEDIDCENNAINVVPKFCSATLKLNSSVSIQNLINFIKNRINQYNYEIDIYKIDNLKLKLSSHGVASHSAHPDLGINAISKLIIILNDIFKEFKISIPLLDNFCKYIGDDYLGKNLELNIEDESGKLTLNTSQFYLKDNQICIGINLRVPINTNVNDVISKFKDNFKNNINILKIQDSLYIDKNNDLVTKLCDVFNETCGTNFEPITIGGATYARAFPNCISFGMNFPMDTDMCHKVDEFIDIDKLMLSTNIYANAIYKLIE